VCKWVINITKYYRVVVEVEPKREALRLAIIQLEEAMAKKNHWE
jgi:hypothetical protein